jgi:hypothetical protein
MKITVFAEFSKEQGDGFDGTMTYTRDDLENLTELAQFLSDAIRGAGFSYVEDVGFRYEDGEEIWGGF